MEKETIEQVPTGTPKQRPKTARQRFNMVQLEVEHVMKLLSIKLNQNDKGYKAVSHDEVTHALHMPLAEMGLNLEINVHKWTLERYEVEKNGGNGAYLQTWFLVNMDLSVKWVNCDDEKDFIMSNGGGYAIDSGDKAYGKALSMAVKNILLKQHMLESRDEEEQREYEKKKGNTRDVKKTDDAKPANAPPAETKPKEFKYDPRFVVPIGDAAVKGRELIDIPTDIISKLADWCEKQLKVQPKVKNFETVMEIYRQVTTHLQKLMARPEPKQDIAVQKFPEDSFDNFPDEKPKEKLSKDPFDYVIPMDSKNHLIRGMALKTLPEKVIRAYLAEIEGMAKTVPPPNNIIELFNVIADLKQFFKGLESDRIIP